MGSINRDGRGGKGCVEELERKEGGVGEEGERGLEREGGGGLGEGRGVGLGMGLETSLVDASQHVMPYVK